MCIGRPSWNRRLNNPRVIEEKQIKTDMKIHNRNNKKKNVSFETEYF